MPNLERTLGKIFHQVSLSSTIPPAPRTALSSTPSWNIFALHVIVSTMAKNHITAPSHQQTPAMSPARTHTVSATTSYYLPDDDEDDICPVCDTECTCNNNRTRSVQQPASLNQYSLQFDGSSSSTISSISHPPSKPSPRPLKIKLTVPPNFLGNTKHASASDKSKNSQETTSAFGPVGESSRNPTHSRISSQRRGRPPKTAIAGRQTTKAAAARLQSTSTPPSYVSKPFVSKNTVGRKRTKKSGPVQKRALKASHVGPKRPLKRKQRARSDDDESSLSNLTDADYDCDDDEDGESVVFPTFVSASVLSSLESGNSSDSSDSSLSFVTDSDVEKEEENFIMSEVHEKARLRRELLGDDDHRRDSQGEWVIRSRKRSVGSNDSDMAVDSAATEDEDEDEDEEPEEDDDEETDGRLVDASCTGLVTAWSDDDESSFDADIFFANLTDSGSSSDSSCSLENEDGEDGDHSDMETNSQNDAAELLSRRQELENLQLDITQGWDGEIVFTNGINDGRGILEIDFEVNASQFMADESPEHTQDSDVDMSSSGSIGAADGDGCEEDVNTADGDTTDEDLVGDDDLPNEQAMKLFSLPFNVSAIDPLSTVSPIASPTSYRRRPPQRRGFESPKPEDILAGKFSWDSDDHDFDEVEERNERRKSQGSTARGPRTGLFVPVQETRKAIIDGTNQVPSPHPRFNRHRSRSTTRINTVEQMLRRRLLNGSGSTPTFPTASELLSPLQILSSDNDFGSPSPSLSMSLLPEERGSLTQSMDIDDVLEASYLGADSSEHSDSSVTQRTKTNAAEDDNLSSAKHMQSLNRWDLISVGAFKQTRENGGWSSDNIPHTPHSSMDYNSIMKPSPLSAIMWPKEKETVRRRRKGKEPMPISPVILAVHDGDKTLSDSGNRQHNESFNKHMQYRKESKRERKLKKKNWGPVHHQHPHQHHYHQHQHHPNSKMRGSVANQRSSLSSVPPFSL